MADYATCRDSRECFAKKEGHLCKILMESYEDGKCPFCKPEREVTDGVRYPKTRS